MTVTTGGQNDWSSVAFAYQSDLTTSTDDSFTPGQKQDATCPTVEGHGNPPKDDFSDIASYTDLNTTTHEVYLYGATIRVAPNGNASENIELKQGLNGNCDATLLARTPGDKLIAIDYLSGGTDVHFHVLTWIASGACYVGNDVAPCWGATVLELSSAGGEGLASQAAITAANNPLSHVALKAGQFAEFGVNLATAGIIPAGTCQAFPQTVWESRSSGSSFVSSTKDVAIENRTISICGTVKIIKHTNPRGGDYDFPFTSNLSGSQLSCSRATATSFTLNDVGNTTGDSAGNTQTCTNVPAGSYTVTEGSTGSNYGFASLSCTTGGTQNAVTPKQADITVTASSTVTCTYVNDKLFGAIKINKNSSKGGAVKNAGAVFSVGTGSVTDNGTGDSDSTIGRICMAGLTPGSYDVNETSPPTGYSSGSTATAQSVTVVAGTDCGTHLPGAGATATFTNSPLSDIQVNFRDGGSGETSATISCDNTTGTTSTTAATGWQTTKTVTGVSAPTTVVCTIVIDP